MIQIAWRQSGRSPRACLSVLSRARLCTAATLASLAALSSWLPGCGWTTVGIAVGIGMAVTSNDSSSGAPDLALESVYPQRVSAGSSFTLSVYGQGFKEGMGIWLEREGSDGGAVLARGEVASPVGSSRLTVRFQPDVPGNEGLNTHLGPVTVCAERGSRERRLPRGLFLSTAAVNFTGPYYSTLSEPRHLAVLDYDGDGNLDLAVASAGEAAVQFLRGTGDGSFHPGGSEETDSGALWLAVMTRSDFEDYRTEFFPAALEPGTEMPGDVLVVATELDVRIIALVLSSGASEFVTSHVEALEFSNGERRMVLADLEVDGDKRRDDIVIMTEEEENPLLVLWDLGLGGSTQFATEPEYAYPHDIAAGDLDADGTDDIVIVSKVTRHISCFLSRGTKQPPVSAGSGGTGVSPEAVAIGDLRDAEHWDPYPDIAVAKSDDEVKVILNQGLQAKENESDPDRLILTETQRSASVGKDPGFIIIGQFGGPERCDKAHLEDCLNPPDLVVANRDSGDVSFVLSAKYDGFVDSMPFPTVGRPQALAAGDFNGDGLLDVAVLGIQRNEKGLSGALTILLQDSDPDAGEDEAPFYYPYAAGFGEVPRLPPGLLGIEKGDLNGDGWTDLVAGSRQSNEVVVVLAAGAGVYRERDVHFFPTGGKGVRHARLGDVDGDGRLDIIVTHRISADVTVLYNDGGNPPQFFERQQVPLGPVLGVESRPRVPAVADFDGDGDIDVLVPATFADKAVFLWNQRLEPDEPGTGDPVLVEAQDSGGRVRFLAQVFDAAPEPRVAEAADLDCDGAIDGLVSCEGKTVMKLGGEIEVIPGKVVILWNEGKHSFTRQELLAWGSKCLDHGQQGESEAPEDAELADEPVEYAIGADVRVPGDPAHGSPPCPNAILAANGDFISMYLLLGPREFDDPRWIPILPILDKAECESAFCVNSQQDSEFVIAYDVTGDGLNDIIVVDEEMGRVFIIPNLGTPEDDACVARRFQLISGAEAPGTALLQAGAPQGARIIEDGGLKRLAVVHRSWGAITIHDLTCEPQELDTTCKTKLTLQKREVVGTRYGLVRWGNFIAVVQEDGLMVQFVSVEGIGASSSAASRADPGIMDVSPDVPVALAAGRFATGGEGEDVDLAVGLDVQSDASDGETSPPILCISPGFQLPPPAEPDDGPEIYDPVTRLPMPSGSRWVALKAADLGRASISGEAAGGRSDLLAATDAGIWILFQGRGEELFELPLPTGISVLRDVVCADLDWDAALDILVVGESEDPGSQEVRVTASVAFGPFGAGVPAWEELPASLSSEFACAGAAMVGAGAGGKEGIILLADKKGLAQSVRCRALRRFTRDAQRYDVGADPVDIRFGDFNRDTLVDVVVANRSPGTITVLVGEGDGSFTSAGARSAGTDVEAILVTDANGDGVDDVIVTNADPGFLAALSASTN